MHVVNLDKHLPDIRLAGYPAVLFCGWESRQNVELHRISQLDILLTYVLSV